METTTAQRRSARARSLSLSTAESLLPSQAASHELKGGMRYFQFYEKGLNTPMARAEGKPLTPTPPHALARASLLRAQMMLIDYKGFRLVAETVVPVSRQTFALSLPPS